MFVRFNVINVFTVYKPHMFACKVKVFSLVFLGRYDTVEILSRYYVLDMGTNAPL